MTGLSRSRAGLWAARQQHYPATQAQTGGGAIRIPDSARSMGVAPIAGKGSGKSVLVGQLIVAQDCRWGIPQVVIEAYGPTIDNCLDALERLPEPQRGEALSRVRYVNMSGTSGSLTAWPLVEQRPGQSLYEATRPYAEVIYRTDPHLQSAPILGWNAFEAAWTNVGMVLAALRLQISEAELLLNPPPVLVQRLDHLRQELPEAAGAVSYLLDTLPGMKPSEREQNLSSFRRKIALFQHDPVMRAMMGASEPTIDWASVVERGETLMLDFRFVLDSERRRFLMLWVFRSFIHFIKRRGAGRHQPVGLVIDELLALYHLDAQAGQSAFASDLDDLLNILARNYRVWPTLAFQEIFQLDERAQKTLLSMGTKIFGVTSDPDAARTIAAILHSFDPTLIKHFLPVYDARGNLIDAQPIYWSAEEQELLIARELRRLKPFHFLMQRSGSEGDSAGTIIPLYVPAKERGQWVREDVVAALRERLAATRGAPLEALLAHIEQRQAGLLMATRRAATPDTLKQRHDRLDAYASKPPAHGTDDILDAFREPFREDHSQASAASQA